MGTGSQRELANPGLAGKWSLKHYVHVCGFRQWSVTGKHWNCSSVSKLMMLSTA